MLLLKVKFHIVFSKAFASIYAYAILNQSFLMSNKHSAPVFGEQCGRGH